MKGLGRGAVLLAAVVLVLVIGLLIGARARHPASSREPSPGMQITTAAPPSATPAAGPTAPLEVLPPPPPAPKAAAISRLDPESQVAQDAAAVGMTTTEEPSDGASNDAGDSPPAKDAGAETSAAPEPPG